MTGFDNMPLHKETIFKDASANLGIGDQFRLNGTYWTVIRKPSVDEFAAIEDAPPVRKIKVEYKKRTIESFT